MRRTKKVAKPKSEEKQQTTVKDALFTVEQLLGVVHPLKQRVSTLQGAKLGAEGLMNVLNFLADESAEDCEFDPPSTFFGLSEVALLLWKALQRETDAMERALVDLERRVAPEKFAPEPELSDDAAAEVTQDQLLELVRLRRAEEEHERPIIRALRHGAYVQPGAFGARMGLGLKRGQVEVV